MGCYLLACMGSMRGKKKNFEWSVCYLQFMLNETCVSVCGYTYIHYLNFVHMFVLILTGNVLFLSQVLRVNETFISVLEADRYTLESDGLLIRHG